ncbi:hypothetical protein BDR03DRAFT_974428 [Suillus americanus]|nr:hypothetical protein BDR03DRAFT_974428 [Suillus americanus]
MPLVHGFTLVVAHRRAVYVYFKKRVQAQNGEWKKQTIEDGLMISYPADSFVADVDLGCLTTLEERISEISEEAGPAGNQQWVPNRNFFLPL